MKEFSFAANRSLLRLIELPHVSRKKDDEYNPAVLHFLALAALTLNASLWALNLALLWIRPMEVP